MTPLPPVRKRTSYADIKADDLVFALFQDRIAPAGAMQLDSVAIKEEPAVSDTKAIPQIDPAAHPGALICLPVPADVREHLLNLVDQVDGDLAGDADLDHITIAIPVAEAAELERCKGAILKALADVAHNGPAIVAELGGLARFTASDSSDGLEPLVVLVDSHDLVELYAAIDAALDECGIEVDQRHGFTPHIMIGYLEPDEPTPAIRIERDPIVLEHLAIVWAGERLDLPFTGNPGSEFLRYDELVAMATDLKAVNYDDITQRIREAWGQAHPTEPGQIGSWPQVVFDTAVIVNVEGQLYHIPYTLDENRVTFAPRAAWPPVRHIYIDPTGAEIKMTHLLPPAELPDGDDQDDEVALAPALAIKAIGDYRVKVRGIIYGGRDLVGDEFDRDTDLGFGRSPVGMPVYYDHAQRGVKSQIGTVTAWQADDSGIDFEVELDRRNRYADKVMQLAERGALGGSTGALSHLVQRAGGTLKRWIVGELSLTPTPAEPRTMAAVKAGLHLVERDVTQTDMDALKFYLLKQELDQHAAATVARLEQRIARRAQRTP